jgi:hypothetical protein
VLKLGGVGPRISANGSRLAFFVSLIAKNANRRLFHSDHLRRYFYGAGRGVTGLIFQRSAADAVREK